ncbi:uncharacterized protein LOC135098210 [Scylla paramamosain]|uniref:uncharacterized protein LOC135098210 n=1 Tax=Scylla paramamosain TaxID=85552 RepID=UPI0030835323
MKTPLQTHKQCPLKPVKGLCWTASPVHIVDDNLELCDTLTREKVTCRSKGKLVGPMNATVCVTGRGASEVTKIGMYVDSQDRLYPVPHICCLTQTSAAMVLQQPSIVQARQPTAITVHFVDKGSGLVLNGLAFKGQTFVGKLLAKTAEGHFEVIQRIKRY